MTALTRLPVLLILLLGLAMAGCADAADDAASVDSGDVDAEIDPVPGTTTGSADTQTAPVGPDGEVEPVPMPVEPDGGIGDGAGPPAEMDQPPAFGVSSETDSTSVEPTAWCWTTSDGTGVCADGAPGEPLTAVTADAQLVITFAPGTLTVSSGGTEMPVEQENPGIYLVDVTGLSSGEHEVDLSWVGDQGDASTAINVTIQR